MEHKIKLTKKTITCLSVCAFVLAGTVGYGAYTQLQPKQTKQVTQPLNPTVPKKKNSLFPEVKSPPVKSGVIKEETKEASLSDFKSTNTTQPNLIAERAVALNTLEKQVEKEQEKKQKNANMIQLNHNLAESSKPTESAKNDKPASEPKPIPTPVPNPEPEPVPEPTPTPVITDYTVLSTLVEQAQTIDLSLYLASSVEQFNVELLVSQRLLEELGSSQTAVDDQVTRLQNAIDQLVAKGNKSALRALYDQSKTIQTDIYTAETLGSLAQAQKSAEDTLAQDELSQATLDTVLATLQQAIDGLKEKEEPDLSLAYLQRVVAEAEGLQMSEYTSTTAQILTDKLAEVKAYIDSGAITKEENEQLTNALRQAIDQLEKKADRAQVNQLLQTIAALDRTLYTTESLQALDSVVANVTSQLDNQNLTQAEADNLYQQLHTAYEQLETVETAEN
jgi:ribosome-associated translation inhibitor RaiA